MRYRGDVCDELLLELQLALQLLLLGVEEGVRVRHFAELMAQGSYLPAAVRRLECRLLCLRLQRLDVLLRASVIVLAELDHLLTLDDLLLQLSHFLRQVPLDDEFLLGYLRLKAADAALVRHVVLNQRPLYGVERQRGGVLLEDTRERELRGFPRQLARRD